MKGTIHSLSNSLASAQCALKRCSAMALPVHPHSPDASPAMANAVRLFRSPTNGPEDQRKKWKAASRKPDDGFYKSDSWRELRFVALKRADGCCALCGRSNRMHGVVLHVDHIKPRSRFPHLSLVASNLQVLCEDCNLGKGNRDTTDWRADNVVQIVWDDEPAQPLSHGGRG